MGKFLYLAALSIAATLAFQSMAAAQGASDSPGECSGAVEQLASEQPNVQYGVFESYLNYISDVGGCVAFEGTGPNVTVGVHNATVYDPDTGEELGLVKDLDPDLSSGDFSTTYEEFCGAFRTSAPVGSTAQEYYDQQANSQEQSILDPDSDGLACSGEGEEPVPESTEQPSGGEDPCANPIGGLAYVPAVNGCLVVETIYGMAGIINGPVLDADTWRENKEELGIFKELVDIEDMDDQIGLVVTFEEFCGAFPTTDIEGYEVNGVSLAGLTAQEYYDRLADSQEQGILDPNGDGLACTSDDEAFLSGDFGDYDETLFTQTWNGLITQIAEGGAESEFWVEAEITPISEMTGDMIGEVVGEVSQVGLDCGGVWILAEAGEDSIVVEERITSGATENCVESVPITLTPRNDGALEYYFLDMNGSVGKGVLTLRGVPDNEDDGRKPSEKMETLGITTLPDTGGASILAALGGVLLAVGVLAAVSRRTR